MNNGIDGFIGNKENIRKFENCLSLANSGSVGSCFYEPFTFVASDHITHLKNKKYGKHIYLYMSTILNRLSEKYNFNREINDERIKREKIVLPTINNKIDFDYMDNFIRDKELKKYQEYIKDTSNNTVFAKAKTKNQGNYHTGHIDNRLNRGALNF